MVVVVFVVVVVVVVVELVSFNQCLFCCSSLHSTSFAIQPLSLLFSLSPIFSFSCSIFVFVKKRFIALLGY